MSTMTDTDILIKEHLLGSGALTYPWWVDASYSDEELRLTTCDPDDPYGDLTGTSLTIDDLRDAALKLLDCGYGSEYARIGWAFFYMTKFIPSLEVSLDLDADSADCLLQMAYFGEVLYG